MDDEQNKLLTMATGCIILGIVILIVMLAGCAPLATGQDGTNAQIDPGTVRSVPMPDWATYPVGQWLNMDWDLWSCPRARGC